MKKFLALALFAFSLLAPVSHIHPATHPASMEDNVLQVSERGGVVHGNTKSKIYHNSSCRYFNCNACVAVFKSAELARVSGYRACKVCGG